MPEEPKESMIFTDVDGTLCFRKELHGMEKMSDEGDHSLVRVPGEEELTEVIDASTPTSEIYIATRTHALATLLAKQTDIVLVSGARPSSMEARVKSFGFHSGAILESGGAIYDKNFQLNQEWHDHLEPERRLLIDVARQLKARGLAIDTRNRVSTIRIYNGANQKYSDTDYQEIFDGLELPKGLKKLRSYGIIDIFLASAGKRNAVKYLLDQRSQTIPETYGIGDNMNDREVLEDVDHGYVLGNANPALLEFARERNMYISREHLFKGIDEILNAIRQKISKR